MKVVLLLPVLAGLMIGTAFSQKSDILDALKAAKSSKHDAKTFITAYYRTIGSNATVVEASVFVPKELKGHHYLVAKAWVAETPDVETARGFVVDMDSAGLRSDSMSYKDYIQFIKTGDRSLLHATKDLSPN